MKTLPSKTDSLLYATNCPGRQRQTSKNPHCSSSSSVFQRKCFYLHWRRNSYLGSNVQSCGWSGMLFDLQIPGVKLYDTIMCSDILYNSALHSVQSNDLCEFNREIKSKHLIFDNFRILLCPTRYNFSYHLRLPKLIHETKCKII